MPLLPPIKQSGRHLIRQRALIIRTGIIMALIVIIGVFLLNLTPYIKPPSSIFYDTDEPPTAVRTYLRAKVTAIKNDTTLTAMPIDGSEAIEHEFRYPSHDKNLKPGDIILIAEQHDGAYGEYLTDTWRWPGVIALLALFVIIVYVAIGKRGLHGLVGLVIGVTLLLFWTVPAIIDGAPAYATLAASAFFIGIVSVFVAHGMNKRALVSAVTTSLLLILALEVVELAMHLAHITGYGDHMALHMYDTSLDLRGIFAGSMLIATVGILEDAVTTQVATVAELHHANQKLTARQLFHKGYAVGKEHIAALINTLVLAYAGVSMLTIISYAMGTSYPLLTLINSEFITGEIVRALVSNIVLVAAIPLSTLLAVLAITHHTRITKSIQRVFGTLRARLPKTR